MSCASQLAGLVRRDAAGDPEDYGGCRGFAHLPSIPLIRAQLSGLSGRILGNVGPPSKKRPSANPKGMRIMHQRAPYGREVRIRIGGPAGFGIKAAGQSLARVFSAAGYDTFDLTEYPSLIKGGHNTYHLRVSADPDLQPRHAHRRARGARPRHDAAARRRAHLRRRGHLRPQGLHARRDRHAGPRRPVPRRGAAHPDRARRRRHQDHAQRRRAGRHPRAHGLPARRPARRDPRPVRTQGARGRRAERRGGDRRLRARAAGALRLPVQARARRRRVAARARGRQRGDRPGRARGGSRTVLRLPDDARLEPPALHGEARRRTTESSSSTPRTRSPR